ncbi:MAG TPA: glycosyltransferase family 4 protein [Gemmatimonadales bacterium]|nr:glycosyltransferase family 4 protein [Gemmatimonadales bacterium]
MGAARSNGGRVAVLTAAFWPEQTGSGQTVTELAEYLAREGFAVRVATSMPWYPQWEIWPEYRGALWRTDTHRGMTIYRAWHLIRPKPSSFTRIMHEVSLSFFSIANMVRALRGADVAIVALPLLSYTFTSALVAALMGVKQILVVKDIMPDAPVELGMMRNPVMIAVSRWMARCTYALASEIHTLGEGMRRRIASVAGPAKEIRIVPDTIDGAELAPVPFASNEFRRRFVAPGVFSVLHTGNMGKKQDLDLIVRAADRLRGDAGVHFYVFGDGAARAAFLERCAALALTNVSHFPLQERPMLRHMLSGADVVLVSQLPEVVDIVVPSKLVTALGAGAMVVAACDAASETARLVTESGGGLVIPPSDEAALVDAIGRIRRGEVDVASHRARARAFALRTFDRDAVYGPLAREIRSRYCRTDAPQLVSGS